ncbi:MAG: hypothetical protein ACNS60_20780 [Candidatus Cyclobacteriaceae bacterium M2_1C_046]
MKYILIIILASALILPGCDDGISIVNRSFSLIKSFEVDVPSGASKTFTANRTFDASTEPEIQDALNRIDSYNLDEFSYRISNYSGEPTNLVEATIVVNSIDGIQLGSTTVSNVDLQAISGQGEQIINLNQSEVDAVEQALLEDNVVNLVLAGEIDNTPVAFTLDFIMDITVEYRVLD